MDREYKKIGNDEFRALLEATAPADRIGHIFEEGHPAEGYCNLVDPKTGVVIVLDPDSTD